MLYENVFFRIIESYIRIMNQNKTMKDMIADERPYEKCERFGAGSLTDIELLAVLLRTGTKGEIPLNWPENFCTRIPVYRIRMRLICRTGPKKN